MFRWGWALLLQGLAAWASAGVLWCSGDAQQAEGEALAASLAVHGIAASRAPVGAAPPGTLLLLVGDDSLTHCPHDADAAIAVGVSESAWLQANPPATATALLRGQPLSRQLALARLLLPEARQYGVLTAAPLSTAERDALQRAAGPVRLVFESASHPAFPRRLQALVRDSQALLSPGDDPVIGGHALRNVLLSGYRQGRPLIGLGAPQVHAGALAAVVGDDDAMTAQLARIIQRWRPGQPLPAPAPATRYRVVINPHVAESLGLPPQDPAELTRRLHAAEDGAP